MNNIKKISALANAKINLFLDVLNKRDDGYHNLSSVFQSVSLADEITVTVADGDSINVITHGAVIESDNLVEKAAELFLSCIRKRSAINISLKKNIPLSAGVGGGSTDAAAILVCLNKLFSNPLSITELLELGLKLGADVPFCILGGTTHVKGIGEKLTPINYIGDYDVILIKQHQKASTGQMYGKIDLLCQTLSDGNSELLNLLSTRNIETYKQISHNDFLNVSDDKENQKKICNTLLENGAFLAGLSGSGPTVFGLFKKLDKSFCKSLNEQFNEVYICKTAPQGIKIIE